MIKTWKVELTISVPDDATEMDIWTLTNLSCWDWKSMDNSDFNDMILHIPAGRKFWKLEFMVDTENNQDPSTLNWADILDVRNNDIEIYSISQIIMDD